MKTKIIEVDEELYRFIASHTEHIGESASDILRRLLMQDAPTEIHIPTPVLEKKVSTSTVDHVMSEQTAQTKDRSESIHHLLVSGELSSLDKAIDRFFTVLSTLYHIDPKAFAEATEVKGRTRIYFADNKEALLASGNTTKPRQITGTPFWVITNTNTNRKRHMVELLMERMAFQSDLIKKVTVAI